MSKPSDKIDWSKIEEAKISPEEIKRIDSSSGKKCDCGKEMTVGEDEAFGVCVDCYAPFDPKHYKEGE